MPDMKTALQNALKGQTLSHLKPQMQRIWEWIRDNPNHTGKDVATELKLKSATTLMSQMLHRKMLVNHMEPVHKSGAKQRLRWRVNPDMRGVYELLPEQKPRKKAPDPAPVQMPVQVKVPELHSVNRVETVFAFDPAKIVADLSLSQSFALWKHLNGYFKNDSSN